MNNWKNRCKALIDAYIDLALRDSHEKNQIIDALLDIFDREDLESLGYGDFIYSYFRDE